MKVRKAVIPAAGLGTRFLPATKAVPKEMLPVVDKPTIQYVVEEALESGITDFLMIIGNTKRAIEEHFGTNGSLEMQLLLKRKEDQLARVMDITRGANIHFVFQNEQKGLGDAVLHAMGHVGDEPFALLLGDTILETRDQAPVTAQLLEQFYRHGRSVLALEQVPPEKVSRYGIIAGKEISSCVYEITDLVEKPLPSQAPSRLAIASRYILTPDIFSHLKNLSPGKNNEIQLTDALKAMASREPLYGLVFNGRRHDIGDKMDYLKTCIEFGLKRNDMREELGRWIKELAETL